MLYEEDLPDEFDDNPIKIKHPHQYETNLEDYGEECVYFEWIYKEFRFGMYIDKNNPANSGWFLATGEMSSDNDGYGRVLPKVVLGKIRELLEKENLE